MKVNAALLVEHVGIRPQERRALVTAIREQLSAHTDRQAIFDGRPSVRLRQLEKLLDALKNTDAGARFLIEGLTTDRAGFPKPEIDFKDIEGRIKEAISGLEMEIRGSSPKQRATETARNHTAAELTHLFRKHYQLDRKEYRFHLDAFLRSLFWANGISYPDPHADPKQRDAFLRSLGLI